MRPAVLLAPLVLALLNAGCHESELEPKSPDALWESPMTAEQTYMLAPVPAVVDPAPVRERPKSISLGFIGDQPLTEVPSSGPRWPYVAEPFHYREPYAYGGYYGYRGGYGRGHYVRVPRHH